MATDEVAILLRRIFQGGHSEWDQDKDPMPQYAAIIRAYGDLRAREAAEDMRKRAAEIAARAEAWHGEDDILALPLKEPGPDA